MRKAVKKVSPLNGCRHYWKIEPANGPTSWGECIYCGAKQLFWNSWDLDKPVAVRNLGEARRLVNTRAEYY